MVATRYSWDKTGHIWKKRGISDTEKNAETMTQLRIQKPAVELAFSQHNVTDLARRKGPAIQAKLLNLPRHCSGTWGMKVRGY